MNKRLSMRLAAGMLALGLVAAACGDDSETPASKPAATGASAVTQGWVAQGWAWANQRSSWATQK